MGISLMRPPAHSCVRWAGCLSSAISKLPPKNPHISSSQKLQCVSRGPHSLNILDRLLRQKAPMVGERAWKNGEGWGPSWFQTDTWREPTLPINSPTWRAHFAKNRGCWANVPISGSQAEGLPLAFWPGAATHLF